MSTADALGTADIAAVDGQVAGPLLAYLNLPPAGALADAGAAPQAGADAAFEIPCDLRRALLERRNSVGCFRSLSDLTGIERFGPRELAALVERLRNTRRYGHRVTPVWGGPEGLRCLFDLVESANHHIHVSTYILGGEVGYRLAQLLARKQRDGVRVRVLFCATGLVTSGAPSGTGSLSYLNDYYHRRRIQAELRESGVAVVNSAPIGRHWRRPAISAEGVRDSAGYERWARSRGLPDRWIAEQEAIDRACALAFAHVDHRKMIIVDGARAFVGGQNVADNYLYANALSPDWRTNIERWQWHDNSAMVEGGSVADMNALFARRWMLSGGDLFDHADRSYAPPARHDGDAVVTAEASIPGMIRMPAKRNLARLAATAAGADLRPRTEGHNPIRDRMLAFPWAAATELLAEHCYPTDAELLERWQASAADGRRVQLIVPAHFDSIVIGYECRRFLPELIGAGIDVREYHRAILHSKIAVADGWYVTTGSYNLNLRSARGDLELQFFIQSPEFGAAVREHVRRDLAMCRPVEPGRIARIRARHSVPLFDALVRYAFL